MATERQIEANRQNARLAKGPMSLDGKTSSSRNSLRHGLAAERLVVTGLAPTFEGRLAQWSRDIRPETAEAAFALRSAVAMSIRIEQCGEALAAAVSEGRARARWAWEVDRMAEAAVLLGKLARAPEVVARQLQASTHGVAVVLACWNRLHESLYTKKGEWSESEVATACDLLGIPAQLRDGRLPFDPLDPTADRHEFRDTFVRREVDRLLDLRRLQFDSLDALQREQAADGTSAVRTKPVQLVLRYERDALRRYRSALKAAKAPLADPIALDLALDLAPAPTVDATPLPDDEANDPSDEPDDMAALLESLAEASALAGLRPSRPDAPAAVPAPAPAPDPLPLVSSGRRPNRHQRRALRAQARRAS